jgi:hypothetical protein
MPSVFPSGQYDMALGAQAERPRALAFLSTVSGMIGCSTDQEAAHLKERSLIG